MWPYNFSAAFAISGSGFHSRKLSYAMSPSQKKDELRQSQGTQWTYASDQGTVRGSETVISSCIRATDEAHSAYRTFLNSFKLQTPHLRFDSIPMTSCNLMISGVPRALKAAAGCSILQCVHLYRHQCRPMGVAIFRAQTHAFFNIPARSVSLNVPSSCRCML